MSYGGSNVMYIEGKFGNQIEGHLGVNIPMIRWSMAYSEWNQ